MRKFDQVLSEQHQKDVRFENVISSLNNQLALSHGDLMQNLSEKFPTIHVLGAPRSGTTLVSQLLPTYLNVGHINNLIAAFWKAPLYGIALSKKIIGQDYSSTFESNFGRTTHINEPHEFGYFWNHHLKYDGLEQKLRNHEENIDWRNLAKIITNITYTLESPVVFKSFLLGFHAQAFYQSLTKSSFIYIKRDLTDNVFSILNLRKNLNGDIGIWGSIKPKQYPELKKLSVCEQIVGQILCLESEYLTQLEAVPEQNKILYKYEELCDNPTLFLREVNDKFLKDDSMKVNKVKSFSVSKIEVSEEDKEEISKAERTILTLYPNLKRI